MRDGLLVSSVAHAIVLVALFWVRTPATAVIPGPDVVQVRLVEMGRLEAPPVRPAERPPKAPEIQVKPDTEEPGVKLAPEKRKKEKKPQEPEPEAPRLQSAPAGNAGLRGDVAVDAANFEFTYYLLVVRNRIASVWAPPAGLAPGGQLVRARVFFRISRGGEIGEIRLEQGSGVAYFDQSALRAVTLSNPMPPLPLGFSAPDLGVHFGFEYGR